MEESPTFSLQKDGAPVVEEDAGKLQVALVKLVNPELLDTRHWTNTRPAVKVEHISMCCG